MSKQIKVAFNGWNCLLVKHAYRTGGHVALELVDDTDGESVAMATVNLPEITLEPGEVLIKDWSENEGMLKALSDAGVVEDTGRAIRTGFCRANICKLLV